MANGAKEGGLGWSNGDRWKLMAIVGLVSLIAGGSSSMGVRWWNPPGYDAYTSKMALADRVLSEEKMRKEFVAWHDRWVRNVFIPQVNRVNEIKSHEHNQTSLELGIQANATELARIRQDVLKIEDKLDKVLGKIP